MAARRPIVSQEVILDEVGVGVVVGKVGVAVTTMAVGIGELVSALGVEVVVVVAVGAVVVVGVVVGVAVGAGVGAVVDIGVGLESGTNSNSGLIGMNLIVGVGVAVGGKVTLGIPNEGRGKLQAMVDIGSGYYNTPVIKIKSVGQIEGIRRSSAVAVATLEKVAEYVRPGVSTQALDDIAVAYMKQNGATAASLGYRGFPKSICVSINNIVCHGIPSEKIKLREGDIVNIDITTIVDGYFGDVSESLAVGEIDDQKQRLLKITKEAMMMAINSIRPGRKLNQCVGKVIEPYVKAAGFSVVRDLGGHGVGIEFHEEPFVYHFATDEGDCELVSGMTFTVEPMVNASPDYQVWIDKKDGWTVRTMDGAPSAQFERTVLVTEKGVDILTKY